MRGRAVAAASLAAVAIATTAVAWWQAVPHLSADDAVTAAEAALADTGLEADVDPEPVHTTYSSGSRDPIEVWEVQATVRAEAIELQLAVAGAHPVAIDDLAGDGASFVLSDQEYEELADNVEDPARERAIRRNIWFTVAAALAVTVAVVHAALAATSREDHR